MLYNIFTKECHFLPSVHGWPFVNIGSFGKCGGMCFAALDRFYSAELIDRNTPEPVSGDDLWDYITERELDLVTMELWLEIKNWTGVKSENERFVETMDLIDNLYPLRKPRVLMLVLDLGILSKSWHTHVVVLHHIEKLDDDSYFLWVYDPNQIDTTPGVGLDNDADCGVIKVTRSGLGNGAIGLSRSGNVYGIFEKNYDKPTIAQATAGNASITGSSQSLEINPVNGTKYRVETLYVSLNWNCNFIPYHSVKIDNKNAQRWNSDGSFSTLKDTAALLGNNGLLPDGISFAQARYPLSSASGSTVLKIKLITVPSLYNRTREIRIDFPGQVFRLDYTHPAPEIISTFYTDLPSGFNLGFPDDNSVHGVVSSHISVVEDYTESLHGELLAGQTVYVQGSKSLGDSWDPEASLGENLFGSGMAMGYIDQKINGIMVTRRFFERSDLVEVSLWELDPSTGYTPIEEGQSAETSIDTFCINDILSANNTNSRVKNGFTLDDYHHDAYVNVFIESSDSSSQVLLRKKRLYAKNRLVFSGIEPPHIGYVEMDLREWLLGPYLAESIRILEGIDIRSISVRNPVRHRKSIETSVNDVLKNISDLSKTDTERILNAVRKQRQMMLLEVNTLLSRKKTDVKTFSEELRKIRLFRYEMLMNNLAEFVLGIAKTRKGQLLEK